MNRFPFYSFSWKSGTILETFLQATCTHAWLAICKEMLRFTASALQFLDEYFGVYDGCRSLNMQKQENNPCRVLQTLDKVAPLLYAQLNFPASAASCGCVNSLAPLFSRHYVASS